MKIHTHCLLYLTFILFYFLSCNIIPLAKCSEDQRKQVSAWAKKISDELSKLGEKTTKYKEIQGSYRYLNAQVETKNLTQLLQEVTNDIELMMDRKSDAIRCIQKAAEKVSQNFTYQGNYYQYFSSKYSNTPKTNIVLPESLQKNQPMYLNLSDVNIDTHFYNLAVDTNFSAVHVPSNIHDRHEEAALTIQWTKSLTEVFKANYNADPALSWQYFGSSSGIMRLYPAKRWPSQLVSKDEFDCRDRTWYIEATTCTKDIIILVDNSGSMDGMGKHIAKLTVINILDTFSNNDYVNVLYYNLTTNYTITCYEGLLVQATPENIGLFKQAMQGLKPMGRTNLSQALEKGFEILQNYRNERGCDNYDDNNSTTSSCNQAIMIITDGVASNLSDIVYAHNNRKGVRLFTYLIGKEVVNVNELLWMACSNRGYYVQVQTLEQVSSSVLQYINVVARPLVLQEKDHPTSWTHAYADPSYDDTRDNTINEPYRLVTSAAVPAFDKREDKKSMAALLGVAGTDVPISHIEKLTSPYKLGVNAFAFIISNNGYVLMHRDLRPMYNGVFRKNYNSIDMVEIEQFDSDLPERVFPQELVNLRNDIVSGSTGQVYNIPIKYHYDQRKRITRDKYNYFYAPLEETPFSLGFAAPDEYGQYSLHVGDEIKNDRHKPGVNIKDYFAGENWKIHPKWVYCKYHYLEGHEYASPEKELLNFLSMMSKDDFIWAKQYETNEEEDITKVVCGRKTHKKDDYYCDRQLIQRLVFDAKNTYDVFYKSSWKSVSKELLDRFNVTLLFVATMSGLTRWRYLSKEVEDNTEQEFGDFHARAIDETWYKSAVIQYQQVPESFVYSVPFNNSKHNEILVTASYAIFPSDGGNAAPGSVVGYQFAHRNLMEFFQNVTSSVSIECIKDCGVCGKHLSCYIIDHNGYIIISEENEQIGHFFGKIEKEVMQSLVEKSIFENVTIYDYQAVCSYSKKKGNSASALYSFVDYFQIMINSLIIHLSWLLLEMSFHDLWKTDAAKRKVEYETIYYDCDKKRTLYMLQQKLFTHNDFPVEMTTEKLQYYIKKISESNLLFIAINETLEHTRLKGTIDSEDVTEAKEIRYYEELACKKLNIYNFTRRRLTGCYNEHQLEASIKMCGKSIQVTVPYTLVMILFLMLYLF